jgi:hypothetical protein
MKFELTLSNCFWLLIPLLLWNVSLGPQLIDPKIISDTHSPKWLLLAENFTRILVFLLPLLIPLRIDSVLKKSGLVIYIIGTLFYFFSWLPLLFAPESGWSQSTAGLLAPRLTPLLPFLGIGLLGSNWLYGGISILFIILHTWHGVQNL